MCGCALSFRLSSSTVEHYPDGPFPILTSPASQLWIDLEDGPQETTLACINQRFPLATRLELGISMRSLDWLDACLAALPDRGWPTVEAVRLMDGTDRYLPVSVIRHTARLSPGLTDICFENAPLDLDELAAAFEGLAAVAPTLQALDFWVVEDAIEDESRPGSIQLAAEALGHLSGLRRLTVMWDRETGPAGVLAPALRALTSLSSLAVRGVAWREGAQPRQPLDERRGSLRELVLG